MPRADYEERRQARIDRLEERRDNAVNESNRLYDKAKTMASAIPFGQPILVGHHSEKRDRNYRKRIRNTYGKAFEAHDKAQALTHRLSGAKSNHAISSDDPEAVRKLKEKIEKAEKLQAAMKSANRIVRSKPKNEKTPEKMKKLMEIDGLAESTAQALFEPDFAGQCGFPDYVLTNNNANLKRMKGRLAELQRELSAEDKETEYDGFRVIEDTTENRVQIDFDSKEDYFRLCKDRGINLRAHGFKFAKSTGMWQRLLNNAGRYAAYHVAGLIANG